MVNRNAEATACRLRICESAKLVVRRALQVDRRMGRNIYLLRQELKSLADWLGRPTTPPE